MSDEKRCPKCKKTKSLSEFNIRRTEKQVGQFSSYCKFCTKLANLAYRHANLYQVKLNQAKYRYGISREQYEILPKECAICYSIEDLHIDHNHTTGNIRNVLCGNCNRGLGMFKDNPNLLIRATDYILKHYDQGPL